jgi:hypothetical protein
MWSSMAIAVWERVAVCGAAGLLFASLSARPVAAQGFAAIAVSPSTLNNGESSGNTSPASVEVGAIRACESFGAKDCKVVDSVVNQCVALAVKKNPNTYANGVGSTREAAAASALAACQKQGAAGIECYVEEAPCASDDPRWTSPLPLPPGGAPGRVDPALVGLWKLNVNGGIWVWQISAYGTYTLHSEAPDKTPSNYGTFLTNNGHYTLEATSMTWNDQGTYTMQGATAVVMAGKLGTGTWYRIASDPGYPARAPGSVPNSVSAPITIRR